ncbi:8-oxoguanine glycosylase ogg1 [Cichlidogyrus casuarinus]|uniref:DNA-(apurinic or apyrimidinic site) lyase n=1 Tax=Cichlidogyrus casuarinus TaxID=1844966 RepID=A0ABD2QCG5_9PLAT
MTDCDWIPVGLQPSEFCLATTLTCGQVFRWKQDPLHPEVWFGEIAGKLCQMRQISIDHPVELLQMENGPNLAEVHNFFRVDVSLPQLIEHWIKSDDVFKALHVTGIPALTAYGGIRLIRQDPIECIFAFITSANNNKDRITLLLNKLSQEYGDLLYSRDDFSFYAFPKLLKLATLATEKSLRELGFGYRAKYICDASRKLGQDGFAEDATIQSFKDQSLEETRNYLLELPGVGPKVADCICLYAFEKREVIPVDVHIGRAAAMRINGGYPSQLLSAGKKRAAKEMSKIQTYDEVSEALSELWQPYAGWAQLIVFALHQAKLIDIRPAQSPKKRRKKTGSD